MSAQSLEWVRGKFRIRQYQRLSKLLNHAVANKVRLDRQSKGSDIQSMFPL
jgi:hypothetical protein